MTEERWQLVPVELTQAMLDATCGTEEDDAAMRATWAELLRVAPSPTPAADEVEAVARAIGQKLYGWGLENEVTDFARDMARAAIAALQARSAEPVMIRAKDGNVVPLTIPENIELQGQMDPASLLAHLAEEGAMESIGYVDPADLPPHIRAMHEDRPAEPAGEEPVLKFIDDYLSPWGSWKTPWWEAEMGDAAFSDHNALKHVANMLRRRPATPTNPERLVADPLGVEEIDLDLMRKREVQAMGAALSTRNWHDMETAYNQLRDKVDREIGRRFRIAKASAAPLKEGSHDV